MDIFKEMKKEHDEFRKTVNELANSTNRAVKMRTREFADFYVEITSHHDAEEAVLVPVLMSNKETREMALEIVEEHDVAHFVLDRLKALPVDDERWGVVCKVLKELIDKHMDEEEKEISPKAHTVVEQKKLDVMGDQFKAEDERLEQQRQPK